MTDKLKKYNRFAIYSALIIFLAIMISGISGLSSRLDNCWLDGLVKDHADHNKPDNEIVVIDIDENSLHQLGNVVGEWPWPRSVHATLIDALSKQHPKAIIFDIFFTEPDAKRAADDQAFIDSIARIDNVFLPIFEKTESIKSEGQMIIDLPATLNFVKSKRSQPDAKVALVMPNAIPSELWKVGAVNQTLDNDGLERRYNIYRTIGGWRLPALPTRLASYLNFPIPEQQDFILNWQQPSAIIYPTFPYSQVLVNLTQNIDYPSKNYFENKIIVIGSTTINAQTNHLTPISAEHPSAQVLATAIDNLKNNSFLSRPFGTVVNTFITLLLLACMLVLFIQSKHHLLKVALGLVVVSAVLLTISYVSINHNVLFSPANPVFWLWLYSVINIGWQCTHEVVNHRRGRLLFGRSVSTEMLRSLSSGDIAQHDGQQTNITVLCCSIQHFSAFTQQFDAKKTIALLNDYFNDQTSLVFKHQGTLDNINGGTLLAFWGAPIATDKQATLAVSAALHMVEGMSLFKKKHNLDTFDISVGVHTGVTTVGMVGSRMQQHYTAIGHTIGITKAIKSLIHDKSAVIISSDTKTVCANDFHFVELGKHSLLSEKIELSLFEPTRKYL